MPLGFGGVGRRVQAIHSSLHGFMIEGVIIAVLCGEHAIFHHGEGVIANSSFPIVRASEKQSLFL